MNKPTTEEEWNDHSVTIAFACTNYAVKAWQKKIAEEDILPVSSEFINKFLLKKRMEYFEATPNYFSSFEEMNETYSRSVVASGVAMRKMIAERIEEERLEKEGK